MGVREPEGPEQGKGSLAWEAKGNTAAVTEMGNLEKVISSVGMSRFHVTVRHPRGGIQDAVRDWMWNWRQVWKLSVQG